MSRALKPLAVEIDPARTRRRRWICIAVALALAGATVATFGLSLWSVALLTVLSSCLVLAVGSFIQSQRPLPVPIGPIPTTEGNTLDWAAPYYDSLCRLIGLGGTFRSQTLAAAGLRPGDKVLDVGCGTGVLSVRAAKIVGPTGTVLGIDPAPDMIRIARIHAVDAGVRVRFEPAAVEALPAAVDSFDVVLASLVLHHLPPDLKRDGLKEVHRVLRPGGRLLIVDLDRPTHWLLRGLMWPFTRHPNLDDHFRGRIPNLIADMGFARPIRLGGRLGVLSMWLSRKPAEKAASESPRPERTRW